MQNSGLYRSINTRSIVAPCLLTRHLRQPYRQALRAPRPGLRLEHAGAGGVALAAAAIAVEIPRGEDVPIAADEFCAAVVAVGAAAVFVVHVAGVHVAQAVFHGDAAGAGERRWRGRWAVAHFPTGVERGEVPRHVGA